MGFSNMGEPAEEPVTGKPLDGDELVAEVRGLRGAGHARPGERRRIASVYWETVAHASDRRRQTMS
jgi:hypothetical protein